MVQIKNDYSIDLIDEEELTYINPDKNAIAPRLSPKQNEFLRALLSKKYKFLLYGGAVGGGKSYLVLGIIDELCRQYPGARFAVCRKTMTVIKRNTIPSYLKILRHNKNEIKVRINRTLWFAAYSNGSQIDFVDIDLSKDPELNKVKGLEITGAVLEEANEIEEKGFSIIKTRIGRMRNKELGIKPFILLTCNPDNNWVKDVFFDPWDNGTLKEPYFYLPALPKDNPFLDQDYLDTLEELPEAEHERYVKGNWNYSTNKNQLIMTEWLKAAQIEETTTKPKYLGIDFAREGDDATVFTYMSDTELLWQERHKYSTANPIADLVEQAILQYDLDPDYIAVDAIGNGASLIDVLIERKVYIGAYKGSETPTSELKLFSFKNRRAEAHWFLREDIRLKRIGVMYNFEFFKQAQVIKYFTSEKCIQIDPKDKVKKDLGYSPDYFDSAVIANFVRHKNIRHGKLPTSFIETVYKQQLKVTLGRNKYLTAVKQMIY